MFTIAHLSDLHLSPLPRAASAREYISKRAIGYLSWTFRRQKLHDTSIAEVIIADIRKFAPDHVALTGDLINISLPGEYVAAAAWLERFGPPDWITVVPGNHDAYVHVPWLRGASLWSRYMIGDLRIEGAHPGPHLQTLFPFVRQRKNVALIGLSTAEPQSLRRAGGRLGERQLRDLAHALQLLRKRGFFRIVLVHHPPFPGQTSPRKALVDAAAFRSVIEAEGAELVLFGHNHRLMRSDLETQKGTTHAIGVSSVSARFGTRLQPASWHHYAIRRQEGQWLTHVTVRSLNSKQEMETQLEFDLIN